MINIRIYNYKHEFIAEVTEDTIFTYKNQVTDGLDWGYNLYADGVLIETYALKTVAIFYSMYLKARAKKRAFYVMPVDDDEFVERHCVLS